MTAPGHQSGYPIEDVGITCLVGYGGKHYSCNSRTTSNGTIKVRCHRRGRAVSFLHS